MKIKTLKILGIIGILMAGTAPTAQAADISSANGKYSGFIQQLTCPSDSAKYGDFTDYGYWGGGTWCGQKGKAGYWVWVNPTWYVWASNSLADNGPPSTANSANGKYSGLIQTISCPKDAAKYGAFTDYGYWAGGSWCGKKGKAGYWVWAAPNWYVWSNAN
ncbi:MAG: hypothetical protein EPN21_03090 [Methylococcaceae bacterium]|nr:MAG: hypothetical protein EPN21_03090 [Methylococcaceae bacterium]